MSQNWRLTGEAGTDAGDYFGHQKKQVALEQRRPVVKSASDLGLGPGISASAVRITDYNDILATFNGYYSSAPGALAAPDAHKPLDQRESFIGQTLSDAELGGRQVFTGLTSGVEYVRTFTRSPSDPLSLGWGAWSGQRILPTASGFETNPIIVPPNFETILQPPTLIYTEGGADNFQPIDVGVKMLRQGVYTGNVQVGASWFDAYAHIYLRLPGHWPEGEATLTTAHINQGPMGQTRYFPFTFWTTGDTQAVGVSVTHAHPGAPLRFWYRISITRLGDAV